ncbi:hypothetical protein AB0M20_33120 [Actinoplanes sp. NPDC051633]|uniref:hypothetical protein n=1 Tax=Actinoplanes sp. NPDC051633 TaxID=3155670 RepID=UPI0034263E2C
MTAPASGYTTATGTTTGAGHTVHARSRRGEETKPSFKTTELIVYVAAVIGVLIASAVTGDAGTDNGGDVFAADKAWWFITLLTIGYMVSRGLAKAGSSTRDHDPRTD